MATEKRLIWGDIAEEHLMKLAEYYKGSFSGDAFERAANEISILPSVDAVEVVHGEWSVIEDDYFDLTGLECSNCERTWWFDEDESPIGEYHYCPGCGAKMDGDGNG